MIDKFFDMIEKKNIVFGMIILLVILIIVGLCYLGRLVIKQRKYDKMTVDELIIKKKQQETALLSKIRKLQEIRKAGERFEA